MPEDVARVADKIFDSVLLQPSPLQRSGMGDVANAFAAFAAIPRRAWDRLIAAIGGLVARAGDGTRWGELGKRLDEICLGRFPFQTRFFLPPLSTSASFSSSSARTAATGPSTSPSSPAVGPR
jgi:hypothetical protein